MTSNNDPKKERASRPEATTSDVHEQEVRAPAGNAVFDTSKQTFRLDTPAEEPNGEGITLRGSHPSMAPDRSRQEHKHDRDETGAADQDPR